MSPEYHWQGIDFGHASSRQRLVNQVVLPLEMAVGTQPRMMQTAVLAGICLTLRRCI